MKRHTPPYRVAFDIAPLYHRDGELQNRSGIHHALDAWLAALMRTANANQWDVRAFAPLGIADALRAHGAAGAFSWWQPAGEKGETPLDTTGKRNVPPANPLLRRVWTRTGLIQAQKAIRNYDLMHVTAPSHLPLSRYAPRFSVATIHDLTVRTHAPMHSPENRAAWEGYFAWIKASGAVVIAVSQATKTEAVAQLNLSPDTVFVVPEAPRSGVGRVEPGAERDRAVQSVGLAPGAAFVLYAGTLEPRKNVPRLICAFARFVRQLPPRCEAPFLVLAGGAWPGHDTLCRQTAQTEGIAERVLFPGYVDGSVMNALMSACSVFAYPSLAEGFGMPPLEAMMCGAPVLTSNVSSLPEVVGEAGVQVDPHNPDAIAAALYTLFTDESENARRRDLSRQRAALFSWDETARQTFAVYQRVLSGRNQRAAS